VNEFQFELKFAIRFLLSLTLHLIRHSVWNNELSTHIQMCITRFN